MEVGGRAKQEARAELLSRATQDAVAENTEKKVKVKVVIEIFYHRLNSQVFKSTT